MDHWGASSSSNGGCCSANDGSGTTTMTIAAVAKMKIKAMRWARPPVDHFEDMNLREFSRYCRRQPDILRESALGPTSMKHKSWEGSDDLQGHWLPLVAVSVSLLLAFGVGLVVGLTVGGVTWGIGSGAIAFGAALLVLFACLVTYMAAYGNGLHAPPMPRCVQRAGFSCNMRANVLCRSFMTCFYNGHFDIVGCIMNGEADNTLKKIQQTNDGQGPPSGGFCWLGDSEFTFWHHLPHDMHALRTSHINAGFGGSRIEDIQRNVHRLCLDWDPSTVIVHASGNDYDYDLDITAGEIPARLLALFETIAAHPSVHRIGYMLSSRRPVYDDAKWDFMVRVHTLTIDAISRSSLKHMVKVLDLRANVWPLDHFVAVDRVHMNDMGHSKESEILLAKILALWPLLEEDAMVENV